MKRLMSLASFVLAISSTAVASDEPFRQNAYYVRADVDGNPALSITWLGGLWGLGVIELPHASVAGSSITSLTSIIGKPTENDWSSVTFTAMVFNSLSELESAQHPYNGIQWLQLTAPSLVSTDWGLSSAEDDFDELHFSGVELNSVFAPQGQNDRRFLGICASANFAVGMPLTSQVLSEVDYLAYITNPTMHTVQSQFPSNSSFAWKGTYGVVPEPVTVAAFGIGVVALLRRRRNHSSTQSGAAGAAR